MCLANDVFMLRRKCSKCGKVGTIAHLPTNLCVRCWKEEQHKAELTKRSRYYREGR